MECNVLTRRTDIRPKQFPRKFYRGSTSRPGYMPGFPSFTGRTYVVRFIATYITTIQVIVNSLLWSATMNLLLPPRVDDLSPRIKLIFTH